MKKRMSIQQHDQQIARNSKLSKGQFGTSTPPQMLEKQDQLAAQIHCVVRKLSQQQRQHKAERHIYDAYYLRSVRNDIDLIDQQVLRCIWLIENNFYWQTILFCLSLLLQILTFFEKPFPDSPNQTDQTTEVEVMILALLTIDVIFTLILMYSRNGYKMKPKRIIKIVLLIVAIVDCVCFIISDQEQIRFARILRPLFMIFYSKDLRRTLSGIQKAIKKIFLLIFIHIAIIALFSFIGINLIGTFQGVDETVSDYGDFFKLFCMLFFVSTMDYYPDILIAPAMVSQYYIIFFVVYLLLFLFLFQPIPLAVVYEGFRKHRMQIAINDLIKQKSAMLASFISLDTQEKGYLTERQFKNFINRFYQGQLSSEDQQILYLQIDKDRNDKIQFEEFQQLIIVLQNSTTLTLPRMQSLTVWQEFREFFNKYGLRRVAEGKYLPNFMLIITLINSCTIIASLAITDESTLSVFNTLDTIFLIIFATECIVKIIGIGIRRYFEDGWNVFDICLVILQALFDYVLFNIIQGNVAQSVKANRILRLAKIQKIFRLVRAFRSIKILKFLLEGLEIFSEVRDLLYKIIMCIPVILRLMLPVQIIFFIFSVIGMLVFGQLYQKPDNPYANPRCSLDDEILVYQWNNCNYTDFSSLSGAYLIMLQIFISASWGQIVFTLMDNLGNLYIPMLFCILFIFMSIFMMALIGGLVWEVFIIVSLSLQNEQEEQLDNDLAQMEIYMDAVDLPSKEETPKAIQFGGMKLKTMQILRDEDPQFIQISKAPSSVSESKNSEIEIPEANIVSTKESKQHLRNELMFKGESPQLDSLATFIIDYYLKAFCDYKDFLRYKREVQNFQSNTVASEYIVHLRNDIKSQETTQVKKINIQNQHLLIQNAVLRDTPIQFIKTQEESHFKKLYGKQFEKIRELKFQNKFQIESKILFSLLGILKFSRISLKYFFQILFLIENQLTYQVLPENSSWKLIHEISGSWYLISFEDKQLVFSKLRRGPWNYADELFTDSTLRYCENLAFLSISPDDTPEVQYQLKSFHSSLIQFAEQFNIDPSKLSSKHSCALFNIVNKDYAPLSHNTTKRSFSQNKGNFTFNLDQSPSRFQSIADDAILDQHKYASRSMIVVLSATQGIEAKTQYQNQILLLQFIQDIGNLIVSYSHNFFEQLDILFEQRMKQTQNH